MGISPFGSSNCCMYTTMNKPRVAAKEPPVPMPNPNPKNYRVQDMHQSGRALAVLVNYPDCTNYEGMKILVFAEMTPEKLYDKKILDPHFSEEEDSPFARFRPTHAGWARACMLADQIG